MVVLAASRQLPAELETMAERIVAALQQTAVNYTATGSTPRIELNSATFTRVIDPGNQLPGYEGVWRNTRNERCGTLTINSDHSFYAEYDLFCPHPRDPRWFVEMVTAWGRDELLRCEAKLIPGL
ncbi:MAG: hypothetical protein WAW35_08120 [Sideroxyarcus sp.]